MIRQRDDSGLYMIGEGAGMGKAGSNAITNSDKREIGNHKIMSDYCAS